MSTSFLKTACDSVITKLKKIKEVINVYNLILLWVMGNRLEVNSIKINSYLQGKKNHFYLLNVSHLSFLPALSGLDIMFHSHNISSLTLSPSLHSLSSSSFPGKHTSLGYVQVFRHSKTLHPAPEKRTVSGLKHTTLMTHDLYDQKTHVGLQCSLHIPSVFPLFIHSPSLLGTNFKSLLLFS